MNSQKSNYSIILFIKISNSLVCLNNVSYVLSSVLRFITEMAFNDPNRGVCRLVEATESVYHSDIVHKTYYLLLTSTKSRRYRRIKIFRKHYYEYFIGSSNLYFGQRIWYNKCS